VNIGGDHSMSIATVADSLNKYPALKVLWFDAHADINTRSSSLSNNYHGMPLSFLTGLDYHKKFNFIKAKLAMNRIMYVGLRDLDYYEDKIIKNYNINRISVDDIRFRNTKSINKILNFVGDNPIHLSFDVDVMDPSVIYSTGTSVDNGLYFDETKYILDKLKNKKIVNMDITELNLDIGNNDERFMSLNNTLKLFENYIR
jgi:arginase